VRLVSLLVIAACGAPPRALPAPHRGPIATTQLRAPIDLVARVGMRDRRDSLSAALAWANELGTRIDATDHDELLAWAEREDRVRASDEAPHVGDLLIFAHDLIGIAVSRDGRGVTELIYLAGGVVRRGFLDPVRPTLRRDRGGAIVNTNMRHGKRRRGNKRYLAGELLANVIRLR
jgi:hypothetical protein